MIMMRKAYSLDFFERPLRRALPYANMRSPFRAVAQIVSPLATQLNWPRTNVFFNRIVTPLASQSPLLTTDH